MSKDENWSELNEQREYKSLNDARVMVVAPKGHQDFVVPLFCPLCKHVMKTREDSESFRNQKSCRPCENKWGKDAEVDVNSREWEEYISQRFLDPTTIINII